MSKLSSEHRVYGLHWPSIGGWLAIFFLSALVLLGCQPGAPPSGGAQPKEPPHTLLKNDAGAVYSVGFSPKGDILATGNKEGNLITWDVAKNEKRAAITNPDKWRFGLRFSFTPDGKSLITGGITGEIDIFDLATKEIKATLEGHTRDIRLLTILKDGKTLVSGDSEGIVTFWDFATGIEKQKPRITGDKLLPLAITLDGKTLLMGETYENAGKLQVWDVANWKMSFTFKAHNGGANSVALTPDGKNLATGAMDWKHTSKLWDLATGKERNNLAGHTDYVFSVAMTSDGKMLATGCIDGIVRLWDVETGVARQTLRGPETTTVTKGGSTVKSDVPVQTSKQASAVHSVAFSLDGTMLAAGRSDGTVSLWHLAPRK